MHSVPSGGVTVTGNRMLTAYLRDFRNRLNALRIQVV